MPKNGRGVMHYARLEKDRWVIQCERGYKRQMQGKFVEKTMFASLEYVTCPECRNLIHGEEVGRLPRALLFGGISDGHA